MEYGKLDFANHHECGCSIESELNEKVSLPGSTDSLHPGNCRMYRRVHAYTRLQSHANPEANPNFGPDAYGDHDPGCQCNSDFGHHYHTKPYL